MTRRRAICLALVCCTGLAGCRPEPAATERKPNIVLVLVDTLRKDGLHLYGNERRTSDAIDALAEEGWVFDHHIASASQTVPSMVSLMLSRHPADHGFADRSRGHFIKNPPFYPEDFVFLAEVLQEAGYTNGGFVTNPYLGSRSRFDQGFEKYVHGRRPGTAVTFGALEWVSDVVRAPTLRGFARSVHEMASA